MTSHALATLAMTVLALTVTVVIVVHLHGHPLVWTRWCAMSVRFACRCGRFLAESAIRTTTYRDDSRYYGIRDEVEWTCTRCGVVIGQEWEPQIVCLNHLHDQPPSLIST